MGSTGNPHIALIAFPFGTHAAPLFALARALAAAAPNATFSFLNSARSNAALSRAFFGASPAGNLRVYDVSDGCPEGYTPSATNPEEEVGLFMGKTPGNFRDGIEAAVAGAGGARVSCVLGDAFLSFGKKLAGEMGVPWFALWTGGPCSLAAHMYTDVLRSTIGVGDDAITRANDQLSVIPYMIPLRVRDLPEGVVAGDLDSGFARLLHSMAQELPNATAVVHNTFHGLDPALDTEFDTTFKTSLPIGPLHLLAPPPPEPDRHACLPWLDTHAPATVVYISFGSFMSPPPPEVAELAAGLEASGAAFLWSMKESAAAHLPPGFVEQTKGRGLVVPWAPQLSVLGHASVGAFVTHCGWNSVMESVAGGKPMLCRPFLGDQRLNAGVVSRVWGIGFEFEGGVLGRDAVAAALGLVLGEEGERMREKAGVLRVKALEAVKPGGSSALSFDSLLKMIC